MVQLLLPVCLQALERKKAEQRHLHEENVRINAESIRTQVQRREEEKLLDMRDMEYTKEKLVSLNQNSPAVSPEKSAQRSVKDWPPLQEREAENDAEQKRGRKEKELEIARLRAQQERAKDYKAEQVSLIRRVVLSVWSSASVARHRTSTVHGDTRRAWTGNGGEKRRSWLQRKWRRRRS